MKKKKVYTVLLIEDDPGDQKLIARMLNKTDYSLNIISIDDGEAAMQYLIKVGESKDKDTPDLIILDLNLPKIPGLGLLKAIKSIENLKMIPVVIFTTSIAENDIKSSYLNFASGYIRKPAEINELEDIISVLTDYWFRVCKLPEDE